MALTVQVYSSGTTPIVDPQNELALAVDIEFSTLYPGGKYGGGSFFVPRNPLRTWEVTLGRRVCFFHGQRCVYEGYVTDIESVTGDIDGMRVNLTGAWGHIMMNWRIDKRWADTRVTEDVWVMQTAGAETEDWTIERQGHIHITPRAGSFTSGEYIALRYTMPTGETVKRLTYDYGFSEKAGQAWEMSMWRSTDGVNFTQMSASGTSGDEYTTGTTTVVTASATGSIDVALATPSQYVELRFYSRGNNNPVNDDHNHGLWENLTVYSETGNINMYEIVKDVVGLVTDVNTSTNLVVAAGSPLSLVPFYTMGFESAADIVTRAIEKGDAGYNRWAMKLYESDLTAAPNGKPVAHLYNYPPTSDYEFRVRLPLADISQDIDSIGNWIIVEYSDVNGKRLVRSPNDSASLTDATSAASYGRHTYTVAMEASTSTIADNYGQTILAQKKDPQWRLPGGIQFMGWVEGKGGNKVHASIVHASQRVHIEDYNAEVSGSGRTFVITQTQYNDNDESLVVSVGEPDAPIMPRYSFPVVPFSEPATIAQPAASGGGGGGGGGGDSGRTITDEQLAKWGLTRRQWWEIKGTARGKALRATLKKKKKG